MNPLRKINKVCGNNEKVVSVEIGYSETDEAVRYLMQQDPILEMLIKRVGSFARPVDTERFSSLTRTIIGQQLSLKAAATIAERVKNLVEEFAPANILEADDDELRACGLSRQKIAYLKDLAVKSKTGEVDLDGLDHLSDEEVIVELCKVKGIGRWSAEMFLIFVLRREDVYSPGDGCLSRMTAAYYEADAANHAQLREVAEKWAPYRSVASLYLWEAAALPETKI